MPSQESPDPPIQLPPEAVLIRRRRLAAGLSVARAAARTNGVVSPARWTQIEQGYITRRGRNLPTEASDGMLAHMATAVNVEPAELEELGKGEAAAIQREIVHQQSRSASAQPPAGRDFLAEASHYFMNESIPAAERREAAERFFKVLPYYALGQEPPAELLEPPGRDDEGGGRESA